MNLALDYDDLDGHGRRVVRLVADEEKSRCTSEAAARLEAREQISPAYAARRSDGPRTSTGPDTDVEI